MRHVVGLLIRQRGEARLWGSAKTCENAIRHAAHQRRRRLPCLLCLKAGLASVSLTLVPSARRARAFGFDFVTTSLPALLRPLGFFTLPSLQWAALSARLALLSDLPLSLGTLHCTRVQVAVAGEGSTTIARGDSARTAKVCLPPLTL